MKYFVLSLFFVTFQWTTYAECSGGVGYIRKAGQRPPPKPRYQIEKCVPAKELVEEARRLDPQWIGEVKFQENDNALIVRPHNDSAKFYAQGRKLYWAYQGSCDSVKLNKTLGRMESDSKCCDLGPITDVQCALGGVRVFKIRYRLFG